jgi:hypothetical protein
MSGTTQKLVRGFVAKQGYGESTVEEAIPLAEACDFILTRSDGMNFSIVCLVDAEDRDLRRFEMEKKRAKEILALCCERYSGALGGAKPPATLVIVEVRRSFGEEDFERLRRYSNRFLDTNAIHAFGVDCSTRKVVTATRYSWLAGLGWRRFLQREMATLA